MLWTAFLLGLLGSVHCLGMCGPLVMAMPFYPGKGCQNQLARLSYQVGRVATYAALGGTMGLVGKVIAIAGWQQGLSILAGVLMLLLALSIKAPALVNFKGSNFKLASVRKWIGYLLKEKPMGASFLVGLLNGLLPCGLIYIALAGAIGSGSAFDGAVYMGLFGLGTLPMMLSVSLFSKWASPKFRLKINKAVPIVVMFIGMLLIVRGLNLGIPYLSPEISLLLDGDVTMCQ